MCLQASLIDLLTRDFSRVADICAAAGHPGGTVPADFWDTGAVHDRATRAAGVPAVLSVHGHHRHPALPPGSLASMDAGGCCELSHFSWLLMCLQLYARILDERYLVGQTLVNVDQPDRN